MPRRRLPQQLRLSGHTGLQPDRLPVLTTCAVTHAALMLSAWRRTTRPSARADPATARTRPPKPTAPPSTCAPTGRATRPPSASTSLARTRASAHRARSAIHTPPAATPRASGPGGDADCPPDSVCRRGRCADPCQNACGQNAQCNVVKRKAQCSCPAGFQGNPEPEQGCVRAVIRCSSDAQCSDGVCISGQCRGEISVQCRDDLDDCLRGKLQAY